MAFLAPSILSADVLKLRQQLELVEENGADYIHIDVMDGHFVPNLTFGPFMVKAVSRVTELPKDVHLMISNPDLYIRDFAAAGASIITVHQEACNHLDRTIQFIREQNCLAGVSINPATPVSTLENIIEITDLVLIMSVNPGYGGQKFIPYSLEKIRTLKDLIIKRNPKCLIEVDGGVNRETARDIVKAGADILVAGNAVFGEKSVGDACRKLKNVISGGGLEI
ncbi:MAG: ribulose-phosphate 3-epimerase [Calditrichaceae bacterium]